MSARRPTYRYSPFGFWVGVVGATAFAIGSVIATLSGDTDGGLMRLAFASAIAAHARLERLNRTLEKL